LIASRRPDNAIGWLLIGFTMAIALAFVGSEAATKYAEASNVIVTLHDEGEALTFVVQDDGCGFDPASVPLGSGTQNMKDRLAALGGTFEVRSSPGDGTTVHGRIPVRAAEPG